MSEEVNKEQTKATKRDENREQSDAQLAEAVGGAAVPGTPEDTFTRLEKTVGDTQAEGDPLGGFADVSGLSTEILAKD